MGWKGALRSYNAAVKASHRAVLKRKKELEKQEKEQRKQDALASARIEVQLFESLIDQITSVHRDCGEYYDWHALALISRPLSPELSTLQEDKARRKFESYKPSLFDRIFFLTEKKRLILNQNIIAAKNADKKQYDDDVANFEKEDADWREMRNLAKNILNGDLAAYKKALTDLNPFDELHELGSTIEVRFNSRDCAEIDFFVNGNDVIPSESKTLLNSGLLSVKKLPLSRFYELYQDYVSGATLRMAREIFAILPLDTVCVNALSPLLDRSTGHIKDEIILSVIIHKNRLSGLNFNRVDASDSLRNFVCKMDFKKTIGFLPVERLSLPIA